MVQGCDSPRMQWMHPSCGWQVAAPMLESSVPQGFHTSFEAYATSCHRSSTKMRVIKNNDSIGVSPWACWTAARWRMPRQEASSRRLQRPAKPSRGRSCLSQRDVLRRGVIPQMRPCQQQLQPCHRRLQGQTHRKLCTHTVCLVLARSSVTRYLQNV